MTKKKANELAENFVVGNIAYVVEQTKKNE